MRKIFLVLILSLFFINTVFAGNYVGDAIAIKDNNRLVGGGARLPYKLSAETTIVFDKDFNGELIDTVMANIEDDMPDVQLTKEISTRDWGRSTELFSIIPFRDRRFEPDRIFVFLGSGFIPNFAASLRVFQSSGKASCFAHLRKDQFEEAIFSIQLAILEHEVRHCLGWGHKSPENVFVQNFDFTKHDHKEILYRLYDQGNILENAIVDITKPSDVTIGFEPSRKRNLGIKTVYTVDNQAKLLPGKYVVKLGEYYICKKKVGKGSKLCRKRKNAKRKRLESSEEWSLDVNNFF